MNIKALNLHTCECLNFVQLEPQIFQRTIGIYRENLSFAHWDIYEIRIISHNALAAKTNGFACVR
jgi:hypothetical protein